MASNFREVSRPIYDYDVKRLVREYEKSLKAIQAELNTLFLTDFERAQIVAVEHNIRAILRDLNKYGNAWASAAITKSATEGIAATLYALHLAPTLEEARKIATFNSINKPLVEAIIADTQADLLAVTQNVDRRTRATVRQVAAVVLREKTAQGINGTQSLQRAMTRQLREKLGSAADSAIVDSAGRKWKLKTYTEMLARTKMLEAHKEATRNEAIAQGTQYGVISRHGATDACSKWEGKVVAFTYDAPGNYPIFDELPRNEIFHPNCKHVITPVRRPDRLPADIRELNGI
ncbi:phage minor capsid protein [Sporosarcina koreensis]|uniref:phage minor capsid protein n=1 Tax=Sporosarcina koreensis TaxID=334735 RepID=UPI00075A6708|nr:phage minor capsid protein [Sporosarcina koreensis]